MVNLGELQEVDGAGDGGCGDLPSVDAQLNAGILYGEVQVAAVSLRFTFQDGDHATAPVEDGVFLYPVPAAHLKEGHLPIRVDGFAADGTKLASVPITR